MGTHRDDIDLAAELRTLRPAPQGDFTEKLDARAAEGFPREGRQENDLLRRLRDALDAAPLRRVALPAAAVGLVALVIATAAISLSERGGEAPGTTLLSLEEQGRETPSRTPTTGRGMAEQASAGSGSRGVEYADTPPTVNSGSARAEAADGSASAANAMGLAVPAHRDVERDAELVLGPAPEEFGEAVKQAFSTVHAVNGVVLSSQIRDRNAENGGEASASFRLLIPSARLGDGLASLSRIADVRSRHDSTLDITAPTVGAEERLDDSRARIDGLLAQLASAESEEERVAIESELRGERREASALQAQLDRLRRRAGFAQVSLRIESVAERDSAGPWGVGDALDDAARILTVAAGVTLIGLAVLGPLALIAVAIWLAHRLWLRRRRESALAQAA